MPQNLYNIFPEMGTSTPNKFTANEKESECSFEPPLTHMPTGKHFPQHSVFVGHLYANQPIHYSPEKVIS